MVSSAVCFGPPRYQPVFDFFLRTSRLFAGFDGSGVLKLFDFGLAKRLDSVERSGNNDYLLTGNTGSLRYMAPEVAKDEPYNLSVDSYSFGILFWQICSLQTPYAGYSQQMHALQVVQRGQRPKPDRSWPLSWVTLMMTTWSSNAASRPSVSEIAAQLLEIVRDMAEDDGVVPSRASEIRAKKKRKKVSRENQVLDVDTRIATIEISNGNWHNYHTSDIV